MDQAIIEKLCDKAIIAAILAGSEILKIYKDKNITVEYKNDNSPLTIADRTAHETISKILEETNIPILSEEGKEIPFDTRKNWELLWIVDPLDGTKEFIKRNGEFTVNIALIRNKKPILGIIYAPALNKIYFGFNRQAFSVQRIPDIYDLELLLNYINQNKIILPIIEDRKNYIIIASRSHLSDETKRNIIQLKKENQNTEIVSIGSSLKFCLIAEGLADVYPRFSPTMEWDTAAGQAIVEAAGGSVLEIIEKNTLKYNKESLLNPSFIVKIN